MGILLILTLSGGQDTGNIVEEIGSGFRVAGIKDRNLMPYGFLDTGNRGGEVGSGFRAAGSIGKNRQFGTK